MYLKRSSTIKYFIAAIVGAALYCEWFMYVIQPLFWERLECEGHDASCTKVLFIADPQIQGDLAVAPPLSYLFNWDSDRYLKSTFSVVLKHFKPDVLVYLGDLMDEGSRATLPKFHHYVKRLSMIFDIDYPVVQVWLPGDNDIGGEDEPIRREKLVEFEKIYDQSSVITFKNVTFYKVNGITYTFPEKISSEDTNLKIVVSHYPITIKTMFIHQIIKGINPDIFFCAHDHVSMYVKQNKDLTHREEHMLAYGQPPLQIPFYGDNLYEIYVPTCSYRMGTNKIGYGAAIMENNNLHMKYTVFWSPTRFPYLYFYLAIFISIICYFYFFCAARLFHRPSIIESYSVDKQPLLERI